MPGRNLGCELALICIGSPVLGLRPVEGLRLAVGMTAYDDEEQLFQAIKVGASAFFLKDIRPDEMLDAGFAESGFFHPCRHLRLRVGRSVHRGQHHAQRELRRKRGNRRGR